MFLASSIYINDYKTEAKQTLLGPAPSIIARRPWKGAKKPAEYCCAGFEDDVRRLIENDDNQKLISLPKGSPLGRRTMLQNPIGSKNIRLD